MANYPYSRNEAFYVQKESAFGIIPNTSGAATLGNSNAFRAVKIAKDFDVEKYTPASKTGSLSNFQFVAGRRSAPNIMPDLELIPSGAAGTAPDIDPFLQSLFGQTPTVVTSTSVTYTLADGTPPTLSVWSFLRPTGFDDSVSIGVVITEGVFKLGENLATLSMKGQGVWTGTKNYFSSASTTEKGGLTAFPTEPSTPVYNGTVITGFVGSATMDGNLIGDIQDATITFNSGSDLFKKTFGSFYPTAPERDVRKVSLSFSLRMSDTATASVNLTTKSLSVSPIVVTLVLGNVAGSIMTITLPKVILTAPKRDEQRTIFLKFDDCMCLASSATAKDEITLAYT